MGVPSPHTPTSSPPHFLRTTHSWDLSGRPAGGAGVKAKDHPERRPVCGNRERPRAGLMASAHCGHPCLRTAFPQPQTRGQRRPKFTGPRAPALTSALPSPFFPQVLTLRDAESPLGDRGDCPHRPSAPPAYLREVAGLPRSHCRKWGGKTRTEGALTLPSSRRSCQSGRPGRCVPRRR